MQPDPIDLSALDFWARTPDEREEAFAELRRDRPVSWHGPFESVLVEPDESTGGYWALTRYEDVRHASRNPRTFCSGRGVMLDDAPPEFLEASQSFLAMDAPRHTKVRGLVNASFTPRQVARIEDRIAANAKLIVDELVERGDCDFAEHVAGRLPMMTIWDLMGLPESQREEITRAAYELVSWNDPDVLAGREPVEVMFESIMTVTRAALELADHRRAHPGDDLMTELVTQEIDGERLTDDEIGAFFVLLAVAGNDTTRHTTSHALKALTDHPDQRSVVLENIDTAVEEFVRWATPVMTFRRTATEDTEIRGVPIAEGDKVVLVYSSANRDEEAFDDPRRFDVTRSPNHHAGFGGGGPHYCMGASLARTQLRAIYTELLRRVPDIEAGEPVRLVGNFINGIKTMPCTL